MISAVLAVLALLLGVSLAVNAMFVIYIWKKNRDQKYRQVDDVPLVEYDIDDDII